MVESVLPQLTDKSHSLMEITIPPRPYSHFCFSFEATSTKKPLQSAVDWSMVVSFSSYIPRCQDWPLSRQTHRTCTCTYVNGNSVLQQQHITYTHTHTNKESNQFVLTILLLSALWRYLIDTGDSYFSKHTNNPDQVTKKNKSNLCFTTLIGI